MNQVLAQAIKHWEYIAPLVYSPKNKKEFNALVAQLDELLNIVEDNEKHPLMSLVDLLSNLIATYEEHSTKASIGTGIDALKFLMESHQLTQADLSQIVSQGVLSELLSGKRSLNIRHIKLLAQYFNVSPATFIDK